MVMGVVMVMSVTITMVMVEVVLYRPLHRGGRLVWGVEQRHHHGVSLHIQKRHLSTCTAAQSGARSPAAPRGMVDLPW